MSDSEQPPVDEVPAEEEAAPVAEEAAVEAEAAPVGEAEEEEASDPGVLGKRKPDEEEEAAPAAEEEPPTKRATVETTEEEPAAVPVEAEIPAEAPPVDPIPEVVDDTMIEMVECPLNMIGRLIGKNGETIKSLEYTSGARIQIDQETKKVSVSGNPAAVQAGVKAVNDCLQAPPEALAISPEASESMECPPGLVGRIIGRGGETIKGLQQMSGATISIDQNFPDNVARKVHISGTAHQVAHGRKLVHDLLQGGPAAAAHLLGASTGPGMNLDCPKDMVGRVIGRGGETIKGLQQHSGARIQIDQNSNPCKVSIMGSQHSVDAATRMIQDIINGGSAAAYSVNTPPAQGQRGGYGPPSGGGYGGYGGGGYGGHGGYGGYGAGGGYGPPQNYGGYGAPGGYGGYGAPQGAMQQGYGGGYGGYGQQDPAYGGYQQSGYEQQQAAPASSSIWQALQDNEGRTYYYNSQTGVSQWEKPAELP